MIRLEKSEALRRKIRQDDIEDLGIPSLSLVRQAIQAGRFDEALEFLDYASSVAPPVQDLIIGLVNTFITHIASFGEEEVERAWRQAFGPITTGWVHVTPSTMELLQRLAEDHRDGHYSNFKVVEEQDRYVVTLDPCGTGGRLKRKKDIAVTKQAYPWSWGKSGVPYYCTHCCLGWEIIPIEERGYPICIVQCADKPEEPCYRYFYKKPELIPEKYYKRIGKTKTRK